MTPENRPSPPPRIGSREARGGVIILRHRLTRWIFVLGLAAVVVFAVLAGIV